MGEIALLVTDAKTGRQLAERRIAGVIPLSYGGGDLPWRGGAFIRMYKNGAFFLDGPITPATINKGQQNVPVAVSIGLGAAPSPGTYGAQIVVGELDPVTNELFGLQGTNIDPAVIRVEEEPGSVTLGTPTLTVS